MHILPVSVARLCLRIVYRVLRAYWFVARPAHHGVKFALVHGDEVLLVRHTYGDRARWEVPGGGVRRREAALDAARREAREELGIDREDWAPLAELRERIDHRRDTLSCFRAPTDGAALTLDEREIAEARWFALARLPAGAAPSVRAIADRLCDVRADAQPRGSGSAPPSAGT